ncbi:MAG: transporter substrate-binding domain-containing protein [Bacillati bacterium ANGP1]|uniref:Transporter substrate-binding domain-containing protein n=1 Tax=Candidatus Segetimicrobium genomatis TaxID=2569760 RepID=A0A537LLT9_9BACT|nr:MAG: transporter substrate-binding domain-containing protein [Terrabacteria group bacterium ANGP1]
MAMFTKSRSTLMHVAIEIVLLSVVVMLLTGRTQMAIGQGQEQSLLKEIHDRGELRVGFALAEPSQFKDPTTGEWKGIAVDIMSDWAKVLGVKFVPVDTSWDAMIPGLLAKKYDFASSLNRRPQRALVVTYSDSFIVDRAVFAVDTRKSQAKTWAELNKPAATICAVLSTAEDSARERMPSGASGRAGQRILRRRQWPGPVRREESLGSAHRSGPSHPAPGCGLRRPQGVCV